VTQARGVDGRTVLITGGNSGIGKETAVELTRMGARVAFTARDASKGADALAEIRRRSGRTDVECLPLDLASFASIRACALLVDERFGTLDVLVNNAGLILSERSETAEGFETTFGVNHLGHFLLTRLLWDALARSGQGRIVNVSSAAHWLAPRGLDFDDLQFTRRRYNAWAAYGASKLANILFTRELARRLATTKVTANAVHPGIVRTGFMQEGDVQGSSTWLGSLTRPLFLSPAQGARTSVHVASSPDLDHTTGKYFVRRRPRPVSPAARDDVAARRLWEVSEALAGR